MKQLTLAGLLLLLSLVQARSQAATENSIEEDFHRSPREERRLGFYTGILNDPWPTLVGFNLAYNVTDFLRPNIGFGLVGADDDFVTTIGGGIKAMVPGWELTPVIGINYAAVLGSGDLGEINDDHFYANVGIDYQHESGFNIGAGLNRSITADTSVVLPYVNIGYFF